MTTKIDKRQARKLYTEGKSFWMTPCKARPDFGVEVTKSSFFHLADIPFDAMVNSFEYYNCNAETGYYAAFYAVS